MITNKRFFVKFGYIIAAVSGIIMALPLIFPALGILQWLAFIPTALCLYIFADDEKIRLRKLYLLGAAYFMPFYVVVFHWFYFMHPMDFAGLSGAQSIFVVTLATFGMAALQTVTAALIFPIFAWLSRGIFLRRAPIVKPFLVAAMFTVNEWWQTLGWWGVPWGRLALGQLDYKVIIQPASALGSYFVSFMILAVNLLIAYALINIKSAKLVTYICAGAMVFHCALGGALLYLNSQNDEARKIRVSAAQDTVTNEEKWSNTSPEANYLYTIGRYGELTAAAAKAGAKVVVWPETVLPYEFFINNYGMVDAVSNIARENNVTILFSTFTAVDGDSEKNGLYNSIVQVNPDGSYGKSIYAKQHLVPFGEFLPMAWLIEPLIPALAELAQTDNIQPGTDSVVFEMQEGKVGGLICFDSIYESLALDSVRNGAEMLSVSTNDAWFKESAALNMHYSQSRLRAIECGRYVIRSANTGISAVIAPTGEVLELCGAGEVGHATADAYFRTDRTLYSYIGNTFVYMLIVFVMTVITVSVISFFKAFSKRVKALNEQEKRNLKNS